MPLVRLGLLTALVMTAFAGNSILCRLALRDTATDPATFTAVRLASGALTLWLLVRARRVAIEGSWPGALALFGYAITFSYAYIGLPAGTGALLLFGAVNVTMIGHGIAKGERLSAIQAAGLALAFGGLVVLVSPGIAAPSPGHAALMVAGGIAWAIYSLLGRGPGDATAKTAGNFVRSVPLAAGALVLAAPTLSLDVRGLALAIASGAVASGLGYALWYATVRHLSAIAAATSQLSVPVIAALGGALLLAEAVDLRLALSSLAVLGGVAMVILLGKRR